MDKTYFYDERPGFESYNMMNFVPGMYPPIYNQGQCSNMNNYDSRISKIETEINNLQNRVSRLEGSMYPQAVDYNTYPKTSYQNSLNIIYY